ncbi:MAG: hypothetical protein ACRDD1_20100 [Planctomycetia bacterium]
MSVDPELQKYADDLDPIFKDVMAAFPSVEPRRRTGYGLATQTIAVHLYNQGKDYVLGDVENACRQLTDAGFLEIQDQIFAHPTSFGEQLIEAVTGRPSTIHREFPKLPVPPVPK